MGRFAKLPPRSKLHGPADLDLGGDDWQAGNPPRVPALVDLLPLQRLPHLDLAGGSEDHNTETASSQAVSSFLLPSTLCICKEVYSVLVVQRVEWSIVVTSL